MNLPDPLLHRDNDQGDRVDAQWRMVPAYQEAYNFRPKAPGAIPTRMLAQDWGTEENPGDTFWTLRGLINSAWRGQGRLDMAVQVLSDPAPLPTFIGHLWTHGWKRQRFFRDMAGPASHSSTSPEAALFDVFLKRAPELFIWMATAPEHLVGPKRDDFVEPLVAAWMPTYENQPAPKVKPTKPNYTGEIFYSFLADLVKPKFGASSALLEKVLALDPLAGEKQETREKSLIPVAVQYRSEVLKAYATQRMVAEHTLHSQGVDKSDRNLPTLLIGKRRWDELRDMGLADPQHRDVTGHTYLHRLVETWRTTQPDPKGGWQWIPRDGTDVLADIPSLIEGWNTLVDLGCDPSQVCQPATEMPRVKSGARKGELSRWRKGAALPGETPMAGLIRRAEQDKEFPEGAIAQFTAGVRQSRDLRNPPVFATEADGTPRKRARQRC